MPLDVLSLSVFAIAVPAVIFAGISKGGFGSGAAFASASILALVLEPQVALGLMLPLLMLIDVSALPSYWRKWDWSAARLLLIGGVPGTVLGAVFLAWANPDLIRLLIGAICLLFVAWQMAQQSRLLGLERVRFGSGAGLVCGVGLGFTSYISHAGGPLAAVYMLGRGLGKTAYQATTVLVFWAVNLLKAVFYSGLGVFTRETLLLGLALAPFALLGTWLGIKAHNRVSERLFFAITYVLLTLTGLKLIWDAAT